MATFSLTIETDNAAFDERNSEIADILRSVAKAIEYGAISSNASESTRYIRDSNGNRVGYWSYGEADEIDETKFIESFVERYKD